MEAELFEPSIRPSAGTRTTRRSRVQSVYFGDGYTQDTGAVVGLLNSVEVSWDALTPAQADEIERFFKMRRGVVPFFYDITDGAQPALWRCKTWKRSYGTPESISATFERRYDVGVSMYPGVQIWLALNGLEGSTSGADFNQGRYWLSETAGTRWASEAEFFARFSHMSEGVRTYVDATGQLKTDVKMDLPRFTFEAGRRQLLLEQPRVNFCRNNVMSGLAAGTPGTAPSGHVWSEASAGLSRQIVGRGVENGVEGAYIRIFGTTTGPATLAFNFATSTDTPAAVGETWTSSHYWRLSAGSLNNVVASTFITSRDASSVKVQESVLRWAPTAALGRIAHTATLSAPTAAFAINGVSFSVGRSGLVVDFTVFIGLPQLEKGFTASSVIRTTAGVVGRTAEALRLPRLAESDLTGAEGTLLIRGALSSAGLTAQDILTTGTGVLLRVAADQKLTSTIGTAAQARIGSGAWTASFGAACGYSAGQMSICANGGLIASSPLLDNPTAPIYVASAADQTLAAGRYDRVVIWKTRLPDLKLRDISLPDQTMTGLDQWVSERGLGGSAFGIDFLENVGWNTRPSGGLRHVPMEELAFRRGSPAMRINQDGTYETVAPNICRYDYDPLTRQPLGALMEGARTNYVRNNTMVGAVVGSPGILPTTWSGVPGSGLSRQVVSIGAESGIDYIDLRLSGTPTSSGVISLARFDTDGQIPAAAGQAWSCSLFARRVAGSVSGFSSPSLRMRELSASNATLATHSFTMGLGAAALLEGRAVGSKVLTAGTTASLAFDATLTVIAGISVDITVRIGLPQIELGELASSPIRTFGEQVTREADVLSYPASSVLHGLTELTFFIEADRGGGGEALNCSLVELHAESGTDSYALYQENASGGLFLSGSVGGVTQASILFGGTVKNTLFKAAGRIKADDIGVAVNGRSVLTDTSAAIPDFGSIEIGRTWFGHVRRFALFPRGFTNSETKTLTHIPLLGSGTRAGDILGSYEEGMSLDFTTRQAVLRSKRSYEYAGSLGAAPSLTFSRASTATRVNETGSFESVGAHELRFDHDVTTLAPRGALLESSRTNFIPNSIMAGLSTGAAATATVPGAPTGWSIAIYGGCSAQIIGEGTHKGIRYFDVRLTGTNGASYSAFQIRPPTIITAAGVDRVLSLNLTKVAGTTDGLGLFGCTAMLDAYIGNTYTTRGQSPGVIPDGDFANSRIVTSVLTTPAGTSYLSPLYQVLISPSATLNITLRFGGWQVDDGKFPSSFIPTTVAGAATRAADALAVTLPHDLDAAEGLTIGFQARAPDVDLLDPNNQGLFQLSSLDFQDRLVVYRAGANNRLVYLVYDGGALAFSGSVDPAPNGQFYRAGMRISGATLHVMRNGVVGTPIALPSVPSGLKNLQIGSSANQHIQSLVVIPAAVPDSEFKKLATVMNTSAMEDETVEFLSRIAYTPSSVIQNDINDYIKVLKSSGVWNRLDVLVIPALHDAQAAVLNLLSDQYRMTPVNNPTYTPFRGFQGNGVSSYLNMNVSPASLNTSPTAKFRRDSAHLSVWALTSVPSGQVIMGARTAATSFCDIFPRESGRTRFRTNGAVPPTTHFDTPSASGFFLGNRTSAGTMEGYQDGALVGTLNGYASTAPTANSLFLLAQNADGTPGGFCSAQVALASVGAALSAAQVSAFREASRALLIKLGALS